MDTLIGHLRFALKHLYDSAALRDSPLVERLGLSKATNPGFELRQILTKTIRSLQPDAGIPPHADVWRVYQVLLYRYVQRCSQLEVADQLGISVRQLRREERRAYRALADRLLEHYDLEVGDERPDTGEAAPLVRAASAPLDADLAWLEDAPVEPVDLGEVLSTVIDLINPLASQHKVRLEVSIDKSPIMLAFHSIALRQILLSLLGMAIRLATGQRVVISVHQKEEQAEVQVRADGSCLTISDMEIDPSLAIAKRLIDYCGGRLALGAEPEGTLITTVSLPIFERLPVLVIDDNAAFRHLLQRYATHTRYRIFGAANFQEGLALARAIAPRIIVLDVMLPETDGWELLGQLREHPITRSIPIVICTILAEEELAYSLGASGFLRKPVTRKAFLRALDDQADQVVPRPR